MKRLRKVCKGLLLRDHCIAIDHWNEKSGERLHFLSHWHDAFRAKLSHTWTEPVYCSPKTAAVLPNIVTGFKPSLCRPIPLERPTILVVPGSKQRITVTFFDANHVDGAVVIFLEGSFGSVLYTGAFRFDERMRDILSLRLSTVVLDFVYFDDTGWDIDRETPSRQQSIEEITRLINNHPGHQILIALHAQGKDDILPGIGEAIDERISVSSNRLAILESLEARRVFVCPATAKDCSSLKRVQSAAAESVRIHEVDYDQAAAVWKALSVLFPTILIYPDGPKQIVSSRHSSQDCFRINVPYVDHSTFWELTKFLNFVRARRIVPLFGYASNSVVMPFVFPQRDCMEETSLIDDAEVQGSDLTTRDLSPSRAKKARIVSDDKFTQIYPSSCDQLAAVNSQNYQSVLQAVGQDIYSGTLIRDVSVRRVHSRLKDVAPEQETSNGIREDATSNGKFGITLEELKHPVGLEESDSECTTVQPTQTSNSNDGVWLGKNIPHCSLKAGLVDSGTQGGDLVVLPCDAPCVSTLANPDGEMPPLDCNPDLSSPNPVTYDPDLTFTAAGQIVNESYDCLLLVSAFESCQLTVRRLRPQPESRGTLNKDQGRLEEFSAKVRTHLPPQRQNELEAFLPCNWNFLDAECTNILTKFHGPFGFNN